MPIESLKTKEEIFTYYEQLEENLQKVRGEIDKLKEEAYNDLVYINQILTSPDDPSSLDIDQVYLKNDDEVVIRDDEEDEETQYLSQPVSQQADSSQVYMTPAESWQTLQNQRPLEPSKQQLSARDDDRTLKSDRGNNDEDRDNETDLDQDEDAAEEDDKTLKLNNQSYRVATEFKRIGGVALSLNRLLETSIISVSFCRNKNSTPSRPRSPEV